MCREHEDQYLAGQQPTDDQMMAVLAMMGLDFSDERGQPLRCTKHLVRVAEAAARGTAGKLPDREAAELEKFEDALTRDREAFLARKRSSMTQRKTPGQLGRGLRSGGISDEPGPWGRRRGRTRTP
jgi:hypothetical protein